VSVPDRRPAARAALRARVAAAARVVSPAWPIGAFVAVNPLGGLVDRPFDAAVATARAALGIRGVPSPRELRRALDEGRVTRADVEAAVARRHPELDADAVAAAAGAALHAADEDPVALPRTAAERIDAVLGTAVAAAVDEETATWAAAFTGADGAAWPMPGREEGFWAAWRAVAGRGPALRRRARPGVRERLAALPAAPEDAVLAALDALRVPAERHEAELRGHVGRQPGWASHARWCEEQGAAGFDVVQLLAVRLTLEAELVAAAAEAHAGAGALTAVLARADALAPAAAPPGPDADPALEAGLVALAALEGAYADRLLAALDRPPVPAPAERPAAQAVFCIDARSEGLRRHLEAEGPFATLGFAGFFAVAMRFRPLGSAAADAQAPVLLDPRAVVTEVAADAAARRYVEGRTALAGAEGSLRAAKAGGASPFALAELGGWAAGPLAAAKTLGARATARVRERAAAAAAPRPAASVDVAAALTPAERLLVAHTALTTMGLTGGFARLVLLCGHGATTENNPYAAALHCGACGGHEGGPNARAAAAILNEPEVRAGLAERGIAVPADTWFVAGRHDTTTDRVELLDRHLVPATHAAEVDRLDAALRAAGARNAADRLRDLPGGDGPARRASDWAQVRPEWGLARNAAFVVGPRALTAGLDLGGRAFLHSYDPAADADGTALETILTAPLVVAQWINAQYLFSTTDPGVLGAGDKVVHNVVGGLGVVQGPGGDLRLGLPRQACFAGDRPFHEPVRLLAVVQAPRDRVDTLVARNAILRHLFDGGWVGLAVREGPGDPWMRRRGGGWERWTPAGAREAVAA
jgi:uncharacterized protein YbcC (UPF0753/DUF2309 family)